MHPRPCLILLLLAGLGSTPASGSPDAAAQTPDWLLGVWEKTQDQDKDRADTLKFLPNGKFVSYGPHCEEKTFPFHMHAGNVYLDIEIPGKGPVALVYRPNASRKALTFTSPRTMNNAVYEQVENPTCGGE